jgi:hypothetical protein
MKTKKGFYFTIIILFCIILLMMLSFEYRKDMSSDALKTRILTANNFVKSIERDASRAIYISSYRTMVAVIDYVTVTHNYINITGQANADALLNHIFAESIFNGTLNQTLNFQAVQGLLANATLKDWQAHTINLSNAIGLEINFSEINPDELVVYQTDPWFIDVSIPVQYNISDPISGVSWTRNTNITTSIPIVNTFEDPYYVLQFGSGCGNKILKNENWPLVRSDCNTDNLTIFLNTGSSGSRYIHSTRSPSYLNRLKGNFAGFREGTTSDSNGIESLIDATKVPSCIGQQFDNSSTIVDFRYGLQPDTLVSVLSVSNRIKLCNEKDDVCKQEAENTSIYGIPSACLI